MATHWGNYQDYGGSARHVPGYSPSTHVRDARLTLLESLVPGLFRAKACLDIGCNAGNVSCQLAFDFDAASVTGVDIDPERIHQAEQSLALRASRVRPATSDSDRLVDYFPISAVLAHGYRFEPKDRRSRHPTAAPAFAKWPRVTFVSADWLGSTNPATSGPYDVILALSVIKWVHLHHGDEGVVHFFRKCSSSLLPGGYLILESQPWLSYEKAVGPRKAPHLRERLKSLTYRPETCFTNLLQRQGFSLCVTSATLPRRIDIYRKE